MALRDKLQRVALFTTCLLGLQGLHKVELGSNFCNECMDLLKAIACCSSNLQRARVTCLLRLATDFFFQRCETGCKKIEPCNSSLLVGSQEQLRDKLQRRHVTWCNIPATCLATALPDKLQEKLHHVTLALE